MQNEFYNQPVVNWAKQNLPQPVEIKLRFASRWSRILIYLLLFSIPLLIIAGLVFLKLQGKSEASWWGVFLCSGVMLFPPAIIVLIGVLIQQKLVKTIHSEGVKSSFGRKFFWKNLYYVDHVSKHYRAGGVSRKIEDNQLEFVFADGKAIIPPLIDNREQIWNLINSMPSQVRDDGKIRETAENKAALTFDEIVKAMQELKASDNHNN